MTTQTRIPEIYQGQFGEFTITKDDRFGVIIYRGGLAIAALCFAIGTALVLLNDNPNFQLLTFLYAGFSIALGVSLVTIHIYMVELHRILQLFWAIGSISAIIFAFSNSQTLAQTIYNYPLTILGIGFTFAALTGIFFKEAFCFNRLETKVLTPVVPLLLLGHMTNILPIEVEKGLLAVWAVFFLVFAIRKVVQAIPPDIGDKSVFEYLKGQRLKVKG
ncbi:DUF2301 domain-containing membrane protein [Plectonema cf. radiosum LEGE 06105]|uniref:DUF2301 domain-containing membrane protein n=1 Tax=Plectonema cf. radiosum LEGE 06105 TaxID=945769 RepID=A0A8J7K0X0_9CYAN|nr:DUF2301 domain-containing membrane protein [Plectonema radiosum]MBE9214171.1 DUF2301 domain-containing membrane protein [Plectonema cf. radiosum LEGE 06105]